MVGDITHLLEVWVAGWAGCRGYETRTEGRFPAARRTDTTGDWEYFASDPSDSEFADLAAKTAEVPARVLRNLKPLMSNLVAAGYRPILDCVASDPS